MDEKATVRKQMLGMIKSVGEFVPNERLLYISAGQLRDWAAMLADKPQEVQG